MTKWQLLANIVVAVIGIITIINVGKTILDLRVKEQRYADLVKEVQDLRAKKVALTAEVAKSQTPAYIEQQARDNLQMVRPGEKLVIVPDDQVSVGQSTPADAAPVTSLPVWKQWVGLIFN